MADVTWKIRVGERVVRIRAPKDADQGVLTKMALDYDRKQTKRTIPDANKITGLGRPSLKEIPKEKVQTGFAMGVGPTYEGEAPEMKTDQLIATHKQGNRAAEERRRNLKGFARFIDETVEGMGSPQGIALGLIGGGVGLIPKIGIPALGALGLGFGAKEVYEGGTELDTDPVYGGLKIASGVMAGITGARMIPGAGLSPSAKVALKKEMMEARQRAELMRDSPKSPLTDPNGFPMGVPDAPESLLTNPLVNQERMALAPNRAGLVEPEPTIGGPNAASQFERAQGTNMHPAARPAKEFEPGPVSFQDELDNLIGMKTAGETLPARKAPDTIPTPLKIEEIFQTPKTEMAPNKNIRPEIKAWMDAGGVGDPPSPKGNARAVKKVPTAKERAIQDAEDVKAGKFQKAAEAARERQIKRVKGEGTANALASPRDLADVSLIAAEEARRLGVSAAKAVGDIVKQYGYRFDAEDLALATGKATKHMAAMGPMRSWAKEEAELAELEAQSRADDARSRALYERLDAEKKARDSGQIDRIMQQRAAKEERGLQHAARVEKLERDISTAANRVPEDKPTHQPKASTKLVAEAFGDVHDRLRSRGPAGRKLSEQLNAVDAESRKQTATLEGVIDDAIKTQYGPFFKANKEYRRDIGSGDMVRKAVAGEPLNTKQQKVWDAWTKVNKGLVDEGEKLLVMTRHTVGESPNKSLIGREAVLTVDGQDTRGTIKKLNGERAVIELADGRQVELGKYDHFLARSAVEPENYFPRNIKPKYMDALRKEKGAIYDQALLHLQKSGQAKDRPEAIKAVKGIFSQETVEIGKVSRLERPRVVAKFPEEFYADDFIAGARSHIGRSAQRIEIARTWGARHEGLVKELQKVGAGEQKSIAEDISTALGVVTESEGARLVRKAVSVEGTATVVSKLTGGLTGVIQLSQGGSNFGILGAKANMAANAEIARSIKSGEFMKLFNDLKHSGAIDKDMLHMLHIDDIAGAAKTITNVALNLPVIGPAPIDRLMRYHAALSGRMATQYAIKKIKLDADGKPIDSANYRLLKDFGLFSDENIADMVKTGRMTDEQKTLAYNMGVKTQVVTHPANLPPAVTRSPLGRTIMRLNTFSYGQAKIFGWAVKETTEGNLAPLVRMTAAYGIGGTLLVNLMDAMIETATGKEPKEKSKDVLVNAGHAMLRTGMLGLLGWPLESMVAFPDNPKRGADMLASRGTPVIFKSLSSLWGAVMKAKDENDFIKALKAGGHEFSSREIVLYKRFYGQAKKKATREGRTGR